MDSPSSQDAVTVRLMGDFTVRAADGTDLLPAGRKARGLLAYLLFHRGKPMPRHRLIDLFWSDRDIEQGRASLRQCVYQARKLFDERGMEAIVSGRDMVAIQSRDFRFDLWDAAGDYDPRVPGELLDGLDPVAPVFDEWLGDMRRVIRAKQLRSAEKMLAEAHEHDAAEIAAAASVVLALDPVNEAAGTELIRALGALGRTSTARAEYRKLEAALAEDGIEISPATRAAVDALAEQSAPRPAPAPVAEGRGIPVILIETREDTPEADHLAEEYGLRLARLPELRVAAGPGAASNGAAGYALQLSAVRRDGQVVCHARLTDRAASLLGWTFREALDAPRFYELSGPLADRAVPALLAAVERREFEHLAARGRTALGAYEHYLRAKFAFFRAETPGFMLDVEADLERAIEADPDFVPAYTHLIQSFNTAGFYSQPGRPFGPYRARAERLAEHLLALDSQHAPSHIAMGWCQLWKRNFAAAERCIGKAVELGSHEAHRLNAIGTALVYLGDKDAGARFYGEAQLVMAHELDYQRTDMGELHYLRGAFDEALAWLDYGERRVRYRTRFWRMLTLAQLGRLPEAVKDRDEMVDSICQAWVGPEPCGRTGAATWLLETLPLRRQEDLDLVHDGLAKLGISP